jgi:hypothetical protein
LRPGMAFAAGRFVFEHAGTPHPGGRTISKRCFDAREHL